MVTGLKPRGFVWVVKNRLALSERIGGHGTQHRRVRREEEIVWLRREGINTVVSLLDGNQNLEAYHAAGLSTYHQALARELAPEDIDRVFATLDDALARPGAVALLHRDIVDDRVAGLLAGYLVHCGLLQDPITATAVIQEIVGRPLGPEGRALIPDRQAG